MAVSAFAIGWHVGNLHWNVATTVFVPGLVRRVLARLGVPRGRYLNTAAAGLPQFVDVGTGARSPSKRFKAGLNVTPKIAVRAQCH